MQGSLTAHRSTLYFSFSLMYLLHNDFQWTRKCTQTLSAVVCLCGCTLSVCRVIRQNGKQHENDEILGFQHVKFLDWNVDQVHLRDGGVASSSDALDFTIAITVTQPSFKSQLHTY